MLRRLGNRLMGVGAIPSTRADRRALSDDQVRYLIGWQALLLVDLLQRRCITVRYAEQVLFNLHVLQRIERRRLKECVEVVDWGMQLEDWEAHTPEHLPEALSTIARLAQRLLVPESKRRDRLARVFTGWELKRRRKR